nr:MAG TPA: hypothetical protein [Caudoviricetes sp.]
MFILYCKLIKEYIIIISSFAHEKRSRRIAWSLSV